jgi:hypothetical protein
MALDLFYSMKSCAVKSTRNVHSFHMILLVMSRTAPNDYSIELCKTHDRSPPFELLVKRALERLCTTEP